MNVKNKKIFRIIYYKNFNKILEIYCRKIETSSLVGFLELSDFVYPEKNTIIIQPNADELAKEFKNVKKTFIPISDIHRVDEISSTDDFHDSHLKIVDFRKGNTKW